MEVLRESLLHLFDNDSTLQPRDVIIMCPDVDTFAPLLAAAFSAVDAPHPGHRLRIRLADRSPARINPLLEVAGVLLDWPASGSPRRRCWIWPPANRSRGSSGSPPMIWTRCVSGRCRQGRGGA